MAEGYVVARGALLARLQSTTFQAQADDLHDQITALNVRRLRLEAEQAGLFDFDVPAENTARMADVVASDRALLHARQTDFLSRRDGATRVLDQAIEEKELLERLLDCQIVALIEVTRAGKVYADARIKLDQIVTQTEWSGRRRTPIRRRNSARRGSPLKPKRTNCPAHDSSARCGAW